MAQFVNMFDVDLKGRHDAVRLKQMVVAGNNAANRIGAVVYDNGQPVTLNGQCTGLVLRDDGSTVPLTGTINGNQAYIVLDQTSCAINGEIKVAVNWVSGNKVTTLVVAYGVVLSTDSGTYVQPSTPIPDMTQLLAEIDNMRQATAAANAAATKAVRYNEAQDLTTAQQATARNNIGAAGEVAVNTTFNSIAPEYDPINGTYEVGYYVRNNGQFYRCKTPVTTPETFKPAKWQVVYLGNDITAAWEAADSDLKSAITNVQDGYMILGDSINGEYVDNIDGTIKSDSGYERTDYIDITDTIENSVTIVSPARSNYNAMYDSSKAKVKTFIVYANTENVYSVPSNVKYIVFSGSKSSGYLSTLKVTRNKTYGTATATKYTNSIANGIVPFNKIGNSYVNNSNGAFVSYNGWTRSDYVDIGGYDKILFTATNRTPFCAFYDSSKTFISSFIIQVGENLITRPATAKYCAFSDSTSSFGNIVLYTNADSKVVALGFKNINDISLKYLDRRDLLAQMTGKTLLMVYTDIHAASDNFQRMANWYNNNLPAYTNAIINLGDMVADQASESIAFMDNAFGQASINVIGNHDVLVGNTWPGITSLEAYTKYIAPNVSSWSVAQPTGAAENGLCYFYKDISKNSINLRIIFLCEYFYTQAQHEWFESVLADAITNNKSVIVCQHQANVTSVGATALGTGSPFATPELGFDLYITAAGYSGDYSDAAMNRIMAVDAFKANGGNFVCWMSGHTHSDQCHTLQATHGKQLSLVFSNAGMSMTSSNRFNGYSQDCFQYVSVDTAKGYIYVLRIGIAEDKWFHQNKFLCYDYVNNEVVEYH